jgi:hypothetical protein
MLSLKAIRNRTAPATGGALASSVGHGAPKAKNADLAKAMGI